jgi:hypothetical protein
MRINMQDKVKEVLLKYPNTKDCDPYLLYYIWDYELNTLNSKSNSLINVANISLKDILALWKNKEISHPSAIMRARRKVQENHPETRGTVWEERHKKQEDVKKQLGYGV